VSVLSSAFLFTEGPHVLAARRSGDREAARNERQLEFWGKESNIMPVSTRSTQVSDLGEEVEALLNPAEPEGVFWDPAECLGALVGGGTGGGLLSPPTPRPKKG
jgi:hypothetical protein